MPKFTSVLKGKTIEDPAADFRTAEKVEQYRLSAAALYIPSGFSWTYLPLGGVLSAEEAHRNITAGHCVTVTERKPAVDLVTETGSFTLNLEKSESVERILSVIRAET